MPAYCSLYEVEWQLGEEDRPGEALQAGPALLTTGRSPAYPGTLDGYARLLANADADAAGTVASRGASLEVEVRAPSTSGLQASAVLGGCTRASALPVLEGVMKLGSRRAGWWRGRLPNGYKYAALVAPTLESLGRLLLVAKQRLLTELNLRLTVAYLARHDTFRPVARAEPPRTAPLTSATAQGRSTMGNDKFGAPGLSQRYPTGVLA